jgi:osmoprotectant transport system ATP-binding protein
MLSLHGITKSFAGQAVIKLLTFELERGKTTALIGPSGCGKSTVLRLIVGLIQPDTGSIALDHEVMTPETIRAWRLRIGYVIQDGGLFPHLDVAGNVSIMARYLGWSERRIVDRLGQLSRLFRFSDNLLDRYPNELSGGQKQRVSLMRAMMLDPDLLLLDEPMAALDPMIRFELQRELREIFAELNKMVLLVTHDMGEAGFLGHQIILLHKGEIVQQGSMAELIRLPSCPYVERFIRAQRLPWLNFEDNPS